MDEETLLMTWSIYVNKNLKFHHHIPVNERLIEYLDSLLFYITKTNFKKIIFIDWNDYPINNLSFITDIWKIYWKKIEILSFKNDQNNVVDKWKWWWEQAIIEFAIKNSKLLSENKPFYKVTWRYIVNNINDILEASKWIDVIFNILMMNKLINKNHYVNTAFFKVTKKFFLDYLWWCWEFVNDNKWDILEKIYFNRLVKIPNMKINSFNKVPEFYWKASNSWKPLERTSIVTLLIRKLLLSLNLYNISWYKKYFGT